MNFPLQTRREPRIIPTYGLGAPEKNPLFFEKRVYQGSCGKVYPLPFIDKVKDVAEPRSYDSVTQENEYVRLVMLPEIGGRIFLGQDKVNNDYDFFYRQDVIKPALVGLAGPWISGGVEFNWPQHHRPGTYMPTDVHVEEDGEGSTVWMSEHDPMSRMKGMHGIRLTKGSALVELKARLYNRTPFTRTFLWWANVAALVHDGFESFFPPDVHYVADHAVRAMSSFPLAWNDYYGVRYGDRPGANDLRWYKNIPVPTSYMVCQTDFDFFGGYDHKAEGGFIHVANRNVAPGKKQWTWGNDEFGWAWDRELTDENGPYVELMAGVYTDNQPDFTYLLPYETKTFSQYWWPYKKIGPVQNANREAALRLVVNEDRSLDLGVVVSKCLDGARIILRDGDKVLLDERVNLSPDSPWQNRSLKFEGENVESLALSLEGVITYRHVSTSSRERRREVATEPPAPADIASVDELYLTAEHLAQYRHPTRYPEAYWEEALKRDPLDARTNIAWGRAKLDQGLFAEAASCFEKAVHRLCHRHPNPCTGEAHYYLGLTKRFMGSFEEAYSALYKATWSFEWRAAAYYELALLDCRKGDFEQAIEHCECALDTNRRNNKAIVLKAIALRKLRREASSILLELLAIDPLDHWARYEAGDIEGFLAKSRNDAQTILDIAYDYADAGCLEEAIKLIQLHHETEVSEVAVPNPLGRSQLTAYALAWLQECQEPGAGLEQLKQARGLSPDYCFPSRLHDQLVLEWALAQAGGDRNAAFGLGNYYFDRKRHEDAIRAWESARDTDPFGTVLRNLGIAYWNVRWDGEAARESYLRALELNPADARLVYEYDQLRKKLGDPAGERLADLQSKATLIADRDDCMVELAALLNETGSPDKALALILSRKFHPWEGGEGQVLKQYKSAHLLLGQEALTNGDPGLALEHFENALKPPHNLGEAYHPLQAKADVNYWQGRALRALGREEEAERRFADSAAEAGDFQAMAVTEHSELSRFRALSMAELGRFEDARTLLEDFREYAAREMSRPYKIDYFATSLPLLLVFEEDVEPAHQQEAARLKDLALTTLQEINELAL